MSDELKKPPKRMGRDRPPLDEQHRKSMPVGVRFTPELRDRLEKARLESGASLSQEIELRLRESLEMSMMPTRLSAHEKYDDGALAPLTAKEAAKILGCDIKSIYAAISRGEIPSIRIGRLRLIPRPAFQKLLRDGAGVNVKVTR